MDRAELMSLLRRQFGSGIQWIRSIYEHRAQSCCRHDFFGIDAMLELDEVSVTLLETMRNSATCLCLAARVPPLNLALYAWSTTWSLFIYKIFS
jgi:hypothetical protein